VPPQARAMRRLLEKVGFGWVWLGTALPPQALAMPVFLVYDAIFFFFFCIMIGQIPAKQIKITQNKQNKSNKTCGFPPMKRLFKVISLTVRNIFKED